MPTKFDDIAKPMNEVLNDDFPVGGHMLKAKQKTDGNATITTQVDFFSGGAATPAKLTWKVPKPLGLGAVSIDKLEMDKSGKFKLEVSSEKLCPVVKFEGKTADVQDLAKATVSLTYTGSKTILAKLETKAMKPMEVSGELTYQCPKAICGLKFSPALLQGGLPDFGVRAWQGAFVGSLVAKDALGTFTGGCTYTHQTDKGAMKYAATYTQSKKGPPGFALGVSCKGLYKLKVNDQQNIFCSIKHQCSKGVTSLVGLRYNLKKGDWGYGVELNIE
mmetsp:Transcript_38929/g.112510  ORF Transcript_38929/g.112510 Transcript_38929/m.112510 type:complete len:275 (-) Transcript_38929:119-943(-)|eukprot:CAMPEP_0170290354 /NCGR_PEP_ID=MMETSP0116_2-20130129/45258_1 /TAXON_ID=400756 /ORGANISM="Durinskia baltica, Strain CSIRO CS-38" /LENGTH=274 /DNA_ID=CAMNT_0010541819 /DNA_START=85 /DNA_END=909 /DNA_ORIENTATION=+